MDYESSWHPRGSVASYWWPKPQNRAQHQWCMFRLGSHASMRFDLVLVVTL